MRWYHLASVLTSFLTLLIFTACGAPVATDTQASTAVAVLVATVAPTERPTTSPTAVPPTATHIPPTATPTPVPTAVPPTPTTKPGLSTGASVDAGSANVTITNIAEASTLPLSKKAPKAGTKFVLIAMKINELKPGEQLASDHLVLTAASGTTYSPTTIYSDLPVVGAAESATITLSGKGTEFTAYFEIASDEDIHELTLSYR